MQAVEGRKVLLPCPLAGSTRDKVYMVLWFKDDSGIPLYSFDVRGKSLTEARHWSAPEIFGPRAHFNVEIDPASLELSDLKRHDQGVYRCRVDFKTSQTQSFRYNLTIIISPEPPTVLNRWGRPLNTTTIGPLEEGDDIGLTCRVIGGRPQPTVKWLVNGAIVDDQYEKNTGDIIENRLTWPSIQRNDLHSIFTCQAINTKLVEAKEISFVLDLYLKPLTIDIIIPEVPLIAERRYEITCESKGSRPNAIITWYKGKRQLRRTKDDIINNTTQSVLNFVPTTEDDGKTITCRAENPNVTGLFLEKIWKLDVVYSPIVTLGLGSTLSADEIKEGDDVYFECHVQANPQWRKLYWMREGTMLRHNTTARIVRSNQSLVLQKITKSSSGNYSCSAINNEGETVSNQILLRVKYVPYCTTDKIIIVGAFRNENLNIVCSVTADPPPRSFRWKFNSSGESSEIGKENFYRNGSSSVLKYKPANDQDFGMLSCWGINEIGEQQSPCLYQIVLAGLPSSVKNCTINNQTLHSIEIQCIGGYDGGLPQVFVLELISMKTGKLRVNLTNPVEPLFIIESIENLIGFNSIEDSSLKAIIFAVNQKGRSPGVILNNFLSNGVVENETAASLEKSTQYSPIILGILLTFIILCISIIIRVCLNKKLLRNSRQDHQHLSNEILSNSKQLISKQDSVAKSKVKTSPRWQHSGNNSAENGVIIKDSRSGSHENHNLDDECDPDVIPSQYVTPSENDAYTNHWKFTNHDTRPKDLLLKTSVSNGSSEYILGNTTIPTTTTSQPHQQSDMDINVNVIKNMLMANRVPESCV